MEFLLNRYRNITVLLLVILAQLLLLAYQVKNNQDVRFIRVWAVTAITPVARVLELVRAAAPTASSTTTSCCSMSARRTGGSRARIGRLKMENQFLKNELSNRRPRQGAGSISSSTRPRVPFRPAIIGNGTGRQFPGRVYGPGHQQRRASAAWP